MTTDLNTRPRTPASTAAVELELAHGACAACLTAVPCATAQVLTW